MRVLVVDDNQDAANTLGMLIEVLGHEVRTAYDGQHALTAATGFQPDLVLLDLGMPKMDGFEACRRIREQPWGSQATVVAVTGWGRDEDRAKLSADIRAFIRAR